MRILKELAIATNQRLKQDTFATKLTIFFAVIVLGSFAFIISGGHQGNYRTVLLSEGDYHVSLSGVDANIYKKLAKYPSIAKLSFSRTKKLKNGDLLIEESPWYWKTVDPHLQKGRKVKSANEIVVSEHFLKNNPSLAIGKSFSIDGRKRTIVGIYDDKTASFEGSVLQSYYDHSTPVFDSDWAYSVRIWFKEKRDTYTETKALLKDLSIDEKKAVDVGRLYYNSGYLECHFIYPNGPFPPRRVLDQWMESCIVFFALSLLFASMIYGAFNVYNSRNLKEIALLKSIGMTKKQCREFIIQKALRLSFVPVVLATITSYGIANLLVYSVYLNNRRTYHNLSRVLRESFESPPFYLIIPTPLTVIAILVFTAFTIYLAAMVPARRSSKFSIIQGLKGTSETKNRKGKSHIQGPVTTSLAKDYYSAYRNSYIVILFTMTLSALIVMLTSVSSGYNHLNKVYNQFRNPYDFNAHIVSMSSLNPKLVNELDHLNGETHIYEYQDFKFYEDDNPTFFSNAVNQRAAEGHLAKKDYFVRILALSQNEYESLFTGKAPTYALINKTPSSKNAPYTLRRYIPLTDGNNNELTVRYSKDAPALKLSIDGTIDAMPYELEEHMSKGIYLITGDKTWKHAVETYGSDPAKAGRDFMIALKTNGDRQAVTSKAEKIITSYVPSSDYGISSVELRKAIDKEAASNIFILHTGIQSILLLIALSNSYNSFHGNLRARRHEFQRLKTIGMTERQIKSMVIGESHALLKRIGFAFAIAFASAIALRIYRSPYPFFFGAKEILPFINYLPILFVIFFTFLGIRMALQSAMKEIE